ncbi:phospho-sugar mutase [Microlunatus kandeliicorticis]|uniref:phospho-sugar mutase n=1 Tax=Microlunatus kandeliicorticis TaxID=1759536 RepID=UPI0015FBEDAC
MFGAELGARVAGWRADDPDPVTQLALDGLVTRAADGDAGARAELEDAFSGRLAFGTAGLRGALGPGPNRMNRVVVGQAAAGLAAWLTDRLTDTAAADAGGPARVVVGHDARYNSAVFARDTAEILAGAGLHPLLVDHPTPTPVIAYGIRALGCVAGVVVTASHNPAQDNGYKVYLGDGSQIVPPVDAEIAARIEVVAGRPLADVPRGDATTTVGPELLDGYVTRLASLVPADAPRELDWVYTPLHGVGARVVAAALAATGFREPTVVTAQEQPDPAFPTVAFPNPEEPGALDLALAAAAENGAELVVANDPDADRCAVAAPFGPDRTGWRVLSGDELGALLADDALRRGVTGTYACSIVSSSLLARMAAAHGQPFVRTLTGFKWIGRVPGLAFGYEEAIGYCCDPSAVADKDGISALARVLTLAAGLRAEGRTLADRLAEIDDRYGVVRTTQLSLRTDDPAALRTLMARLRTDPPTVLGGSPVRCVDLAGDSAAQGGPELPPTDGLLFTGGGITVVVRPSGTEPKLKSYLEVAADPAEGAGAAESVATRLELLRGEVATLLGLG